MRSSKIKISGVLVRDRHDLHNRFNPKHNFNTKADNDVVDFGDMKNHYIVSVSRNQAKTRKKIKKRFSKELRMSDGVVKKELDWILY